METYYSYALLDPRLQGQAANDAIFKNAEIGVLGIEVTVPKLAQECKLGNIDPQHSQQSISVAAIEEALVCQLPLKGATLATVRADLDSIGAMAIITMRANNVVITDYIYNQLKQVAAADKFEKGEWRKQPLPSKTKRWPSANASASDLQPLAAVAAAVSDFKLPIDDRVAVMHEFLTIGTEPASYREKVEHARDSMIEAIESGEIQISVDNRLAMVNSTHLSGPQLGYCFAPVVLAYNSQFQIQGGEPHLKYTISQYRGQYLDIESVKVELNALEPGWGGSTTIVGSPQGIASQIKLDTVVSIVKKHMK